MNYCLKLQSHILNLDVIKRVIISICFLVLFFTACTKNVLIPKTAYYDINCYGSCVYRLKTNDNHVYEFKTCKITKETLIIYLSESSHHLSNKAIIPFERIKKLERIIPRKGTSLLASISAPILLSGIIYLAVLLIVYPN